MIIMRFDKTDRDKTKKEDETEQRFDERKLATRASKKFKYQGWLFNFHTTAAIFRESLDEDP